MLRQLRNYIIKNEKCNVDCSCLSGHCSTGCGSYSGWGTSTGICTLNSDVYYALIVGLAKSKELIKLIYIL